MHRFSALSAAVLLAAGATAQSNIVNGLDGAIIDISSLTY